MELTIYKESDMWTAHVDDKIHSLMPSSRSLLFLVRAIHKTHPGSTVQISESISNNPYLANHIVHMKWMRMTPDYSVVQEYLDHPAIKICDMCECEAWYNEVVRTWQCLGCNRVQFRNDSHFFKLSRHAKNQGGNAFRTRAHTQAIIAKKKEVRDRKEIEYVQRLKAKYNLVERSR